jgi:fluoride exporter
MARRTSASMLEVASVVAGGAVGAVLRYVMSTTWPSPHQVLLATVLTAATAFLIVGFLLGASDSRVARALVATTCGAAASLSAYSIIGVGQTPWLAAAFLLLTPAAALAALVVGLLLARTVRARTGTSDEVTAL